MYHGTVKLNNMKYTDVLLYKLYLSLRHALQIKGINNKNISFFLINWKNTY